jgi:hypothetical protein
MASNEFDGLLARSSLGADTEPVCERVGDAAVRAVLLRRHTEQLMDALDPAADDDPPGCELIDLYPIDLLVQGNGESADDPATWPI